MSDFMAKWLKLSLVAVVGCGFIAMMVYALMMKDDLQNSSLEPPMVEASDIALKRRPEEPGGMEIPHQDKMVFDLLDSPSTAVTGTEGDVAANPDLALSEADVAEEVVAVPETVAAVVESPTVAAPAEVAKVEEPVAVAKVEPKIEPKPEPKPEPVVAKVEPKPEPKKEVVKVVEPKVEAKTGGAWAVQVASLGSEADATKAIAQFDKNKALAPLTGKVVKADLGAKGVKYRVQFGRVASRDAAAKVCVAAKVSCIPVPLQ
ncbi:MAG: SPOR domain-containing protein [Alphaproteobacteria bacterium]